MRVTWKEDDFALWFRQKPRLEQIAIRAVLLYNDDRLLNVLRKNGKCLDCPIALTFSECENEIAFLSR